MKYDNVDKHNLKNIGIACIMKKKQIQTDDKVKTYYEIVDCVCGFAYEYKDGSFLFTSLSKNLGSELPLIYDPNKKFLAAGFKTFSKLCEENNNTMDIDKFMSQRKKIIGTVYFYNEIEDRYDLIKEEKILKIIESTKEKQKEFDENVLNKDSDISQIYNEIKKTIISQDEQIMKILTTLFKNQKVVNSNFDIDMINKLKENIIVYGSTGTGKTEILKRIAKIYKVPIVIEDATSLTESGFIGRKITDMLNNLYLASGKNMESAEKGILVIDEFDKLAEKDTTRSHVSREGVQRSLLKLLDGTEYYFDGLTFNTSKLSIVSLGAFTEMVKNDDYTNITTKDFVEYGIMRELMGRFSKLVAMNNLSKEDIKRILLESNFSPINTYKYLFEVMGIEFTYDDDFIDYIAEKAIELESGARSLKAIFDDVISSAMFRIFAGDYSNIHLTRPTKTEKAYMLTKKR
ncbi:MAG: AAA family ATPase [Bacilli bacterium]|nr:AAA family ATPase [Bacilli bacterium]